MAEKEKVFKTKVIDFMGGTTPIILQNNNGACPLIAICNVLLLKGVMKLGVHNGEVSLEKLLSLVAEQLIDSNSNVDKKEAEFTKIQQHDISDALDLLPQFATGIDVNIKFSRINDFEFTREYMVFDLLGIPLYHGWIVHPQDYATVNAIGVKCYNTLMCDLVGLKTRNMKNEFEKNSAEDCVDFVDATTATLGVPSSSLSRFLSFNESSSPGPSHLNEKRGQGDLEEEANLLSALKLSESYYQASSGDVLRCRNIEQNMFNLSNENADFPKPEIIIMIDTSKETIGSETQKYNQKEPLISYSNDLASNDLLTFETIPGKDVCLSSKTDLENCEASRDGAVPNYVPEESSETAVSDFCGSVPLTASLNIHNCEGGEQSLEQSMLTHDLHEGDSRQNTAALESAPSSENEGEPFYEVDEWIMDSGTTTSENLEPVYEGEIVIAEQLDKNGRKSCGVESKNEITPAQGELIQNFLKSSASQLTEYGLSSLQADIKEQELCVFFRNNHFNTLFKFEGELFLLATDQGYINHPDLVWEKLNEVNGNTCFTTGNFKEFKVVNQANKAQDEQTAVATTDYLAVIDNPAWEDSSLRTDMELAWALQMEYELQPPRNSEQPTAGGGSRPVTGAQDDWEDKIQFGSFQQ